MADIPIPQLHLEVQTLRYFIAFVQEGTTSGAAKRMRISQPSLSRQITNLEKRIGAQLYTREGRHVRLTERGRMLYEYAQKIVELTDKAEEDLTNPQDTISGYVFIGHGEPISMHLATEAMTLVHHAHPDVRFHVFTGSISDLFERLDAGVLDFMVEGEMLAGVQCHELPLPGVNRWGVVMRNDACLASAESIAPQDLTGRPVVCSRQVLKVGLLQQWAGDLFRSMDQLATFNSGSYLLSLVAEAGAYVFTYEDVYREAMNANLVFRPLYPPLESRSSLFWRKDRVLSKAAGAYLETLQHLASGSL